MNLFEKQVHTVLQSSPELTSLKPVVEKEILHHDILRVMHRHGFLKPLVFIGGTCLRMCHGSSRLSEDLDFSGGNHFNKNELVDLCEILKQELMNKYDVPVEVSEPRKESGNVSTWKIKVITQGNATNLPSQRINIDICAVPSHDVKPSLLINHYSVDLGTRGIILPVESLEEILADKILAFAMRPNRVKNRDIWDMLWLKQRNAGLNQELLLAKLEDRKLDKADFLLQYRERLELVSALEQDYQKEMQRFLPVAEKQVLDQGNFYWHMVLETLAEYVRNL